MRSSDYDRIIGKIDDAWDDLKNHPYQNTEGVDEMSISKFKQKSKLYLSEIKEDLVKRKYKFNLLKPRAIPKKNQIDERILLIGTVKDRIVSKAILLAVGDKFNKKFPSKINYCPLIPHSGAKKLQDAVQEIKSAYQAKGFIYVFETDIEDFFNSIDKEKLLKLIQPLVDNDTFNLIKQVVNFDIKHGDQKKFQKFLKHGYAIAQGSSLSPLFANIYLNQFDKTLSSQEGVLIFRYVDDLLVLSKSESQRKQLREVIEKEIGELGLKLKQGVKTREVNVTNDSFEFLGINFTYRKLTLPQGKTKDVRKEIEEILNSKKHRSLLQKLNKISFYLESNVLYYTTLDKKDFKEELLRIVEIIKERVKVFFEQKQKEILGFEVLKGRKLTTTQINEYYAFLGLNFSRLGELINNPKD